MGEKNNLSDADIKALRDTLGVSESKMGIPLNVSDVDIVNMGKFLSGGVNADRSKYKEKDNVLNVSKISNPKPYSSQLKNIEKKEEGNKMGKVQSITALIRDIRNIKKSNDSNTMASEIKKMENLLYMSYEAGETSTDLLANALRGEICKVESDALIYNFMKESAGADGGYIVPDDIQTEVKDLRMDGTDLESLVNVETVGTDTGRRTYEIRAAIDPLEEVAEGDTIPEIEASKLKAVIYKTTKRAGILNASAELLEDANETLINWLKKWIAKKSKATRSSMIITVANAMTAGKEVSAETVAALRTAAVITLHDAYKDTAIALTNNTGYEYLETLVDAAGDKILEKDPTQSKVKLLFGLYPVKKVPDALLANGTGTVPIFIGDFKEAITLFDREKATIDMAQMINALGQDTASFRLKERLDAKAVDTDAIIKVNLAKA